MFKTEHDARLSACFQAARYKIALGECIAPEKIAAAVRHEIPLSENRRIIDHCALCPHCAEEWRVRRKAWQCLRESFQELQQDGADSTRQSDVGPDCSGLVVRLVDTARSAFVNETCRTKTRLGDVETLCACAAICLIITVLRFPAATLIPPTHIRLLPHSFNRDIWQFVDISTQPRRSCSS